MRNELDVILSLIDSIAELAPLSVRHPSSLDECLEVIERTYPIYSLRFPKSRPNGACIFEKSYFDACNPVRELGCVFFLLLSADV